MTVDRNGNNHAYVRYRIYAAHFCSCLIQDDHTRTRPSLRPPKGLRAALHPYQHRSVPGRDARGHARARQRTCLCLRANFGDRWHVCHSRPWRILPANLPLSALHSSRCGQTRWIRKSPNAPTAPPILLRIVQPAHARSSYHLWISGSHVCVRFFRLLVADLCWCPYVLSNFSSSYHVSLFSIFEWTCYYRVHGSNTSSTLLLYSSGSLATAQISWRSSRLNSTRPVLIHELSLLFQPCRGCLAWT